MGDWVGNGKESLWDDKIRLESCVYDHTRILQVQSKREREREDSYRHNVAIIVCYSIIIVMKIPSYCVLSEKSNRRQLCSLVNSGKQTPCWVEVSQDCIAWHSCSLRLMAASRNGVHCKSKSLSSSGSWCLLGESRSARMWHDMDDTVSDADRVPSVHRRCIKSWSKMTGRILSSSGGLLSVSAATFWCTIGVRCSFKSTYATQSHIKLDIDNRTHSTSSTCNWV